MHKDLHVISILYQIRIYKEKTKQLTFVQNNNSVPARNGATHQERHLWYQVAHKNGISNKNLSARTLSTDCYFILMTAHIYLPNIIFIIYIL